MPSHALLSRISVLFSGAFARRILPPLLFLLALCLMVAGFYDSGYTSLPPTGKRYDTAKLGIQQLRQDARRAGQREPWLKLAAEFRAIYDADPAWPNRPAALFRAAEALEELAHRSLARADVRKAIACYEQVAQRHADSRLADDALFRAAKLRAAWLKDDKNALNLLARLKSQYPQSDMREAALALEKSLNASARGRTAPEARQVARTDLVDVQETADDSPKPREARGRRAKPQLETPSVRLPVQKKESRRARPTGRGMPLLERAAAMTPLPDNDLMPRYREAKARLAALREDRVRGSQRQPWEDLCIEFLRIYQARKTWAVSTGALFRAASSLECLAERSHIPNEYRQARDLYLKVAQEFPKSALADDALLQAARLDADKLRQKGEALELLDALAAQYASGDQLAAAQELRDRLSGKASTAAASKAGTDVKDKKAERVPSRSASLKASLVNDMATQLGLTVRTVFIDAGHGGKDPGTMHNGVVEREIALDVALTLGRLLQANGIEVAYSRTRNTTVPLRQRTAMTNAVGADLFVSIHVNASTGPEPSGFETYYLDMARNPEAARLAALENAGGGQRLRDMQKMLADVMLNARMGESRHLAIDIQRLALSRLKRRAYNVRDNGVKSAPFLVLLGTHMPAVLVEIGYCTNPAEARNLLSAKYRMAIAEGIAEGILAYKDRLLKRRTVQNSLTPAKGNAI